MMPPFEAATFEVIESELALQLLVNALGLPTLFDRANDLLRGHAMSERREIELRRFCIVFEPFDDEPDRLPLRDGHVVVVCGLHATKREARRESLFGAGAPRHAPKCFFAERDAE